MSSGRSGEWCTLWIESAIKKSFSAFSSILPHLPVTNRFHSRYKMEDKFQSSTHLPPHKWITVYSIKSGGIKVEDSKSIFHTAKH